MKKEPQFFDIIELGGIPPPNPWNTKKIIQ
jgi:hypothetical protein